MPLVSKRQKVIRVMEKVVEIEKMEAVLEEDSSSNEEELMLSVGMPEFCPEYLIYESKKPGPQKL